MRGMKHFEIMFPNHILDILLGAVILVSSIPDAASYQKYGRTCQDIGCMRDEMCVIAEDPCSLYRRDNCGRYPTCVKARPGEANCASTVCGENEYCKTENGMPTCVKKSTAIGYESAGISYVNGHHVSTDDNRDKSNSNSASNSNPYANANAPPPPPPEPAGGHRQVNSGSNLGYPPYPSNSGSANGYPPYPSNSGSANGYPPYPSSNQGSRQQDLGYPPYPSHNRMPVPGHPGQASYPGYPGQAAYPAPSGYPQQYPGYQNYPQNHKHYNTMHSGFRKNNGVLWSSSGTIVCLTSLIWFLLNRS